MSQKYLIPDNERPITADCNGNLDYIFMRYADLLLIHAEASMEIGDEDAAKSSLKLIRERAGLSAYPDSYNKQLQRDLSFKPRRIKSSSLPRA